MLQPELDFDVPDIRDHHGSTSTQDCRYPQGCCEAFGFLKKAIKGIGKGIKAVGKVAHKVAPALAFIPGVGTVLAGGIGAIGGLAAGKGLGGMLSGFAKGAGGGLLKGLGGAALSRLTGGGGGGGLDAQFGPGGAGPGGGGGFGGFLGGIGRGIGKGLDFLGGAGGIGGGLRNLGGLAAGGLALKASADQRKSAEAFNQQLLNVQREHLVNAEEEFDRKAPLRKSSQTALLQAIQEQSTAVDPFSQFIKSSKKRKPGEFSKRAA